jgi:hypothetical protein
MRMRVAERRERDPAAAVDDRRWTVSLTRSGRHDGGDASCFHDDVAQRTRPGAHTRDHRRSAHVASPAFAPRTAVTL